jgi:hypothetical protein
VQKHSCAARTRPTAATTITASPVGTVYQASQLPLGRALCECAMCSTEAPSCTQSTMRLATACFARQPSFQWGWHRHCPSAPRGHGHCKNSSATEAATGGIPLPATKARSQFALELARSMPPEPARRTCLGLMLGASGGECLADSAATRLATSRQRFDSPLRAQASSGAHSALLRAATTARPCGRCWEGAAEAAAPSRQPFPRPSLCAACQ